MLDCVALLLNKIKLEENNRMEVQKVNIFSLNSNLIIKNLLEFSGYLFSGNRSDYSEKIVISAIDLFVFERGSSLGLRSQSIEALIFTTDDLCYLYEKCLFFYQRDLKLKKSKESLIEFFILNSDLKSNSICRMVDISQEFFKTHLLFLIRDALVFKTTDLTSNDLRLKRQEFSLMLYKAISRSDFSFWRKRLKGSLPKVTISMDEHYRLATKLNHKLGLNF
jgi:hypothetical protein